jgi:hypothetical protein
MDTLYIVCYSGRQGYKSLAIHTSQVQLLGRLWQHKIDADCLPSHFVHILLESC